MLTTTEQIETHEEPVILYARIPGPDRKRTPARYSYRLTYRDLESRGPCCIFVWEVSGGRLPYQIALERDEAGALRMHCTCADAVYRGDNEARFCKHVRGLLYFGQAPEESPPAPRYVCVGA